MVLAAGVHRPGNRHADTIDADMFLQVVQEAAAVRLRVRARHGDAARVRTGPVGVRGVAELGRDQRRDAHQLPVLRAGLAQ